MTFTLLDNHKERILYIHSAPGTKKLIPGAIRDRSERGMAHSKAHGITQKVIEPIFVTRQNRNYDFEIRHRKPRNSTVSILET